MYKLTLRTFLVLACLAALPALAQNPAVYQGAQLTLTGGASLYVQGDLQSVAGGTLDNAGTLLITGDLLHQSPDPVFTNPGLIQFVGTTPQTIGGTGTGAVTFDNIDINKVGNLVLDLDGVSITGALHFYSGYLYLNDGITLALGTTGQVVKEQESSHALGPGTLTVQAVLNAPSPANPGGLGLLISSGQNLGTTTIIRGHTPTGPEGNGILRYFQVNPANNQNLDATLRFHYFDAELNGLEESTLAAFTSPDGTDWTQQEVTASSPADNYVEYGNLASLNLTTLSQGNAPPLADAGADQAICEGASVQIGGSPTASEGTALYTYSWEPSEGMDDATIANPTASPTSTTTYTVTVTDANNNTAQASVEITVHPLPALTFDPVDPQCVDSEAVDLSASVSPAGGTFSGPGSSGNNFDPVAAGVGAHEITYTFTDGNGCENSAIQTLVVGDDTPPVVVTQNLSIALDANGEATITAEQVDNGSSDNCVIASLALDQTLFTCEDVGENTVTLTVTDANGNQASNTATVTVADELPPQITPPADIVVSNDPEICGAVVDLGTPVTSDHCGVQEVTNDAPTTFDVGTTIVTWTVADVHGNENTATQTIEVTNDVPVLGDIVAPVDPVMVGATINVSAPFTGNNLSAATWDWGDGSSSEGQIGAGTVSGSYGYGEPGVYTLNLTVTDACGEQAMATFQFVVVYDPNGGFVTGGGWINSPAEASTQFPEAEGKAHFGFVAKYKKGAHVPTGNTQFQFKTGDLNFHSSVYEWLVIAGAKAKFKGEGTINEMGSYGFMVSAIDGAVSGGGGSDKFRIKIWDKATEVVVYDNQMGDGEDADTTTVIGGGSIVIHSGKGKNAREVAESSTSMNAIEVTDNLVNNSPPGTGYKVNIYPNPVVDHTLYLECSSGKEGRGLVRIIDLSGRMLITQKVGIVPGVNQIPIDAPFLTSGQYVVYFEMEEVSVRQKVIKY